MADEPTDQTNDPTPEGAPDPEQAINDAQGAADAAAEQVEEGVVSDEAAAALAAAMAAVSSTRQSADAAAAPAPEAPKPKPAAPKPKPDAADAKAFSLSDLAASLKSGKKETLDLLSDVQLHVRIELGRTRMYVEDVLHLGDGAVVELDKLAGDPVDVFVNDRHVARGEVLVLNDNFCVRISEILDPGAEKASA